MGKIIFVLKCVLIAFCFYGRTRVYESFKLPIFMGFMVCDLVIWTLYAYLDYGCLKWLIAYEGLKHRVFEVSLVDLQGDEDHAFKKIRLRAEDVQGKNVLTNFWVWWVMPEASFDCNIVLHYTHQFLIFVLFFEFLGNGFQN